MLKSHSSKLALPGRLEQGAVYLLASGRTIVEVKGHQGSRRNEGSGSCYCVAGELSWRVCKWLSLLEIPVQGCLCGTPINGVVDSSISVFLPFVVGRCVCF